jgi:hypothetical protein
VVLALDGLQPDVGHEVLWVVRDCLSGEVLLARSLLSGRAVDLLREAAHPVFEADRHAKVALKAEARGVRPIERALEGHDDPAADVARGYCAAVRSAITDDGRTPLAASGLRLKARLEAVADSLDRVAEKGAASPAAVLRGEVRLVAATATRLRPPSARDLGRVSQDRWRDLRERLDRRRRARTLRTRFRRDPGAYLAVLELQACQPALPS